MHVDVYVSTISILICIIIHAVVCLICVLVLAALPIAMLAIGKKLDSMTLYDECMYTTLITTRWYSESIYI